jgi:hypothetical protein
VRRFRRYGIAEPDSGRAKQKLSRLYLRVRSLLSSRVAIAKADSVLSFKGVTLTANTPSRMFLLSRKKPNSVQDLCSCFPPLGAFCSYLRWVVSKSAYSVCIGGWILKAFLAPPSDGLNRRC